MEIADVRKRVQRRIDLARRDAVARRERSALIESAYARFLSDVAEPLFRQLENVLHAEGHRFRLETPKGSLRLSSERSPDEYIEIALDTQATPPTVVGRARHARGRRVIADERRLGDGEVSSLTDEVVLAFVVDALGPFVER